jgi:hypothetical protein
MATAPVLADVLRLILPPEEMTRFLRACLLSGPAVHAAWARWLGAERDPGRRLGGGRAGAKRHLPLLYVNLSRHGASIDPRLLPYFRTALVRDDLRHRRYDRITRSALTALAGARVDVVVVKGAALAATVFDPPALRHCHDIDLLIPAPQLGAAVEALTAGGFASGAWAGLGPDARVEHTSGLRLMLHTRLVSTPFYALPTTTMLKRTRTVSVAGVPARVMSAADMLVHVCAIASESPARDSLSWAVDACLLARTLPTPDWDIVVATTREGGLALPLFVMLSYLAEALEAPVPAAALAALRAAATGTDRGRRQAAIRGIRVGARGRLSDILRISGWQSRWAVLGWMLAPSPAYLRWIHPGTPAWRLPACYVTRPLRFVARRFGRARPGPLDTVTIRANGAADAPLEPSAAGRADS